MAHHENRVVARLLQGCYKVVTRLLTSSQPLLQGCCMAKFLYSIPWPHRPGGEVNHMVAWVWASYSYVQ